MHLEAHAVVLQGVDAGAVQRPVTGQSLPLVKTTSTVDVHRLSRERYGQARTAVEAAIRARTQGEASKDVPLGRRRARRQEDL